MTYHGILIPKAIKATNVDSYNRTVVDALPVDNGNVFVMGAKSVTAGLSEVFEISVPLSAGSNLTGLWMAYSGDEIVVTDAKYKGLDPDPRNFFNAANSPFSAFKPALDDIIMLTDDALGGSYVANTTTHINATNSSWKLVWGNSQTASVLSYKFLGLSYISLATGAIDSQRVVAYEFTCVGL